ncbi:MAG TPA: Nif3-like dinuclear metal center hexameric protein [Beutenbergiaceae bacterium]|nr:Nif3-like dinuclear metal center hexameric protein [Beutenbergiaceae bacterium]
MEDLERTVAQLSAVLSPGGAGGPGAATGLVSGDPGAQVRRVLFATSLTDYVVDEAIAAGVELLVVLMGPSHIDLVGAHGRLLRRLIRADIALYNARHAADNLISRAISELLGIEPCRPLISEPAAQYAMLIAYTPEENAEPLRQALASAGAGAMGEYTGCAWSVTGMGEFTPQAGADPTIGEVGAHEQVSERRLEMVVPLNAIAPVTEALRSAHPYEEPAFSFVAVHSAPGRSGRGRVGDLPHATTLAGLARRLGQELPASPIRTTGEEGDHDRLAVAAGADDEAIFAAARAGAHVFVSADISADLLEAAHAVNLALIDVPRAQLSWPALPILARELAAATNGELETIVSTSFTASWKPT